MTIQFAAATDVGRLRPNNEDAILIDAALGVAALADGMGGYNAGEVASRLCCETVVQSLREHAALWHDDPRRALLQAIRQANRRVYEEARTHPALRGMATTVVVAGWRDGQLIVAHVGDSRLYRLRQGLLAQLTRDHTLVQDHVDAGLLPASSARLTGYRNLVTRAVGVAPWVDIDLAEHAAQAGDTYLLCSDGLTDMLTDAEIARILRDTGASDAAARALVAAANAAGGRDNITVALIHCPPRAAPGA